MNILFLTSTLPRYEGDSQAPFVIEQAEAWKKARPNDAVAVLAPHAEHCSTEERSNGVHVFRFRYAWPASLQRLAYPAILPNLKRNPFLGLLLPPFLLCQTLRAFQLIRKRRIDCLYAHWVVPQAFAAVLANLLLGTPYALQNHSSDFSVLSRLPIFGKIFARFVVRRSIAFFCVNSMQRDFLLSLFDEAEREAIDAKTLVRPMGIAKPPEIDGDMESCEGYDIGTFSRLSRKKGISHFIEAVRLLRNKSPHLAVAIAGDGELRSELQEQAHGSGIHFLGFLSGKAKARFLRRTTVFVAPSQATGGDVEGLPVSLLEALSLGKPLVVTPATNLATLPEWGSLKQEVFVVDDPTDHESLANALERALESATRPVREGAEQRRLLVCEKYLWENLIREYIAMIEPRIARLQPCSHVRQST